MIHVLLIHAGKIPHYRVPIYNYLSAYLKDYGFSLSVISDGLQQSSPHTIHFHFTEMTLSTLRISRFIKKHQTDIIIDYMELRHRYLFPTYLIAKLFMRKKMIYWGQSARGARRPDCRHLEHDVELQRVFFLQASQRLLCPRVFSGRLPQGSSPG